jgi:hypothetical protein
MIDDETFFAWIDGELSDEDAARVESAIAGDSALAERARRHRALRERLNSAFDGLIEAPIPERLTAAVRPSADIVDFAAVRRARAMPPVAQWMAMAATLAVGLFVGTMVPSRSAAPVEVHGGKLYAAAALDDALDKQLASAPGGDVRIGLTFRDQSGVVCRTFTDAAAAGLACRDNDRWQVRGMFAAPEGQQGSYRMAAGMDPNLAALVDSTIAGDPFGASAEKAARDHGWK